MPYDVSSLISYDASTHKENYILKENHWWICIDGDVKRALAKRISPLSVTVFCNPHKSVVDDMIQNVLPPTLKLAAVFLEIGYAKCS